METSHPNHLNSGLTHKSPWGEATVDTCVSWHAFPTWQADGSSRLSLTAHIQPLQNTPSALGLTLKLSAVSMTVWETSAPLCPVFGYIHVR